MHYWVQNKRISNEEHADVFLKHLSGCGFSRRENVRMMVVGGLLRLEKKTLWNAELADELGYMLLYIQRLYLILAIGRVRGHDIVATSLVQGDACWVGFSHSLHATTG